MNAPKRHAICRTFAPVTQAYGHDWPGHEPLIYRMLRLNGLWFNPEDPADVGHWHAGIDYGMPVGIDLYAPLDGIVSYADWDKTGFGWRVDIAHGSFHTLYAHLSAFDVRIGHKLLAGQRFGASGQSGNATGPHLHFAVYTMFEHWQVFHDPAKHFAGLMPRGA